MEEVADAMGHVDTRMTSQVYRQYPQIRGRRCSKTCLDSILSDYPNTDCIG